MGLKDRPKPLDHVGPYTDKYTCTVDCIMIISLIMCVTSWKTGLASFIIKYT